MGKKLPHLKGGRRKKKSNENKCHIKELNIYSDTGINSGVLDKFFFLSA